MIHPRPLWTLVPAVLVACACTGPASLTHSAGDRVGSAAVSTAANGTTSTARPRRPREIRLQDRDPCDLIPESAWKKFGITMPGQPQQNDTFKSPECFYGTLDMAMGVTLVITEGVEAWRAGNRTAVPTDIDPIRGFPTMSLGRPMDTAGCDTVVDVADGQYLLATVIVLTIEGAPNRCDWARGLAEAAMTTLVAS